MSVVRVASYTSIEEAVVTKSMLQAYGVPVWLVEEHFGQTFCIYLQGTSRVH